MDNNNDILDSDLESTGTSKQEEIIISENKFMFLCFISFGLYQVWWIYKAWRFFQQRENLDIIPAARAIFSIFFLHGLFERILSYASSKGYGKVFSPTSNYFGYILVSLLSRLPEPFWLITLMNFTFLIPAFRALNFAKMNSSEIKATFQNDFTGRQIALISFGGVFWFLVIAGLFFTDPALRNL